MSCNYLRGASMFQGSTRIAVLVCVATTIEALPNQLTLKGTVLDATLAPVPGARITATIDGSAGGPPIFSDQYGEFSLSLEPGKYTLSAAKEGFVTVSQTVGLPREGSGLLEIVLQVTPVRDVVTVTENSGYLTPATA